jgi:phenylpyruvate tautomerase PptA (4-oxalocrotonate tautomerase family)
MPIVHVHILAGRPPAQKKALLDGIHSALVEAFKIPEQDRHQILHEHAAEHFDSADGRFTAIELTVFPGRSLEAKRKLYQLIVENLERAPGIPPASVLITLHEPPPQSWGVRGGKAGTDITLGFKVDV